MAPLTLFIWSNFDVIVKFQLFSLQKNHQEWLLYIVFSKKVDKHLRFFIENDKSEKLATFVLG